MKKFTIVLTVMFAAMASSQALAKEASLKEWEERKNAMLPLQFRSLIEENHRLKEGNKELTEKVQLHQQEFKKLRKLKAKVDALRKQRGQATTEKDDNYDNLETLFNGQQRGASLDGVVFKVQIGAYKERDLSDVLEGSHTPEFEQEKEGDLNKYTIGYFRDYKKANRFKKELRAMGVKDAWIVPFKDGKRVPLKDVLDYVRKK